MRIDFRKGVHLAIGLVASGTLITSNLMATPAHAFIRHPAYGRSVDREAIRQRIARQPRASRSVLSRLDSCEVGSIIIVD